MPSIATSGNATPAGPLASPAFSIPDEAALQLVAANRALWSATLSLMTAFMHAAGPAHRYLIARRIERNFETLSTQDCFDHGSRASFTRLAGRWRERAEQFSPDAPTPRTGLRRLFS